jgi:hypothetical protein
MDRGEASIEASLWLAHDRATARGAPYFVSAHARRPIWRHLARGSAGLDSPEGAFREQVAKPSLAERSQRAWNWFWRGNGLPIRR